MRQDNKPRAEDGATLHWVAGSPPSTTPAGASFGVPWAKGEIDKTIGAHLFVMTVMAASPTWMHSARGNHRLWQARTAAVLAIGLVRGLGTGFRVHADLRRIAGQMAV